MSFDERYSLDEAGKEFAKRFNGRVWQLLEKNDRTPDENEEMIYAAYASLYHWRQVGSEVHHQRGEWMLAHVYTVLGECDLATKHAKRCLELTGQFRDQMNDFDIAYGFEGIARASALCGDRETSVRYLELGRMAGEAISGAEDKEIFMGDFNSGEWYGVR